METSFSVCQTWDGCQLTMLVFMVCFFYAASSVLMEGSPTYPTPDRIYEIMDRLKVNVFYTSPTVIRTLMNLGDHYVKPYNRSSLRILSFGGEPINPEAWLWFWSVVGEGRCSVTVSDIWGQTETVNINQSSKS